MLRDYQEMAIDCAYHHWEQGKNRIILTLATGLGKSVIIEKLLDRWNFHADGQAIVTVHKRKLVEQLEERIKRICEKNPNLTYGVDMGERKATGREDIVVGTIQSISKRLGKYEVTRTGLIIVDEAHHDTWKSKEYTELHEWSLNNYIIKKVGLTATLQRSDGVGYTDRYDAIAFSLPLQDGVELGWLVRPVPYVLGVKGLKFADMKSDFTSEDVAKILTEDEKNLHIIAGQIIKFCGDKKFIVFMPTKQSARMLRDILNNHPDNKYQALSIDCDASEEERQKFFEATKEGGWCRQLIGCDMLTEGYDCPDIEVVVICTKVGPNGQGVLLQRVGRGTRPLTEIAGAINAAPNAEERKKIIAQSRKPEVAILDLCGFSDRHNFAMVPSLLGKECTNEIAREIGRIATEGLGVPTHYDEVLELAKARIEARKKEKEREEQQAKQYAQGYYAQVEIEARKLFGWKVPKDINKIEYKPGVLHPTPKQIELLRNNDAYIPGMTFKEAKQIIAQLMSGSANSKQLEILKQYQGFDPYRRYDYIHADAIIECMKKLGKNRPIIKIDRSNVRLVYNRESKRYYIYIKDEFSGKTLLYRRPYISKAQAVHVAQRIADNYNPKHYR